MDNIDKYLSSAGSFIGVLPRPQTLWVCNSETWALVIRVLWSPEMRLLCRTLNASILCLDSGDTTTMHEVCLCKSIVKHGKLATATLTTMSIRARRFFARSFEIEVVTLVY